MILRAVKIWRLCEESVVAPPTPQQGESQLMDGEVHSGAGPQQDESHRGLDLEGTRHLRKLIRRAVLFLEERFSFLSSSRMTCNQRGTITTTKNHSTTRGRYTSRSECYFSFFRACELSHIVATTKLAERSW